MIRFLLLAAILTLSLGCPSGGVSLADRATTLTCETPIEKYLALACPFVGSSAPGALDLKYALCIRAERIIHETKMIACMADGKLPPSI